MLVKQFPNLDMVRKLRNDAPGPATPLWNNIALNVKCKEAFRTGVESPYSIFMNNKGHSYCSVNGRQYKIETDTFLISRPGEQYDLVIDNLHQTEIFNIHINRDFFHSLANSLVCSDAQLLGGATTEVESPYLLTQLYARDERIIALTKLIAQTTTKEQFEVALARLTKYLLTTDEDTRRKISVVPAASAAVREELFRRVVVAKDIIHSCYDRDPDLDELSREAAMSKFHFLRVFKSVYGITPHQYLVKVRMEKAAALLKNSPASINEIAASLGFEYPNSFIKAFKNTYGIAPLQYRKF